MLNYILRDYSYTVVDTLSVESGKILFLRKRYALSSKVFLVMHNKKDKVTAVVDLSGAGKEIWYPQVELFIARGVLKVKVYESVTIFNSFTLDRVSGKNNFTWQHVSFDNVPQNKLYNYTDNLRRQAGIQPISMSEEVIIVASQFPCEIKAVAKLSQSCIFYIMHRFFEYRIVVVTDKDLKIINYYEVTGEAIVPRLQISNKDYFVSVGLLVYKESSNQFTVFDTYTPSRWVWDTAIYNNHLYYRTEKNSFVLAKINLNSGSFSTVDATAFKKALVAGDKYIEKTVSPEILKKFRQKFSSGLKSRLQVLKSFKDNVKIVHVLKKKNFCLIIVKEKKIKLNKAWYIFLNSMNTVMNIRTVEKREEINCIGNETLAFNDDYVVLNQSDCRPLVFEIESFISKYLAVDCNNVHYIGIHGKTLYCSTGDSVNLHVLNIETAKYFNFLYDYKKVFSSPFYVISGKICVKNRKKGIFWALEKPFESLPYGILKKISPGKSKPIELKPELPPVTKSDKVYYQKIVESVTSS